MFLAHIGPDKTKIWSTSGYPINFKFSKIVSGILRSKIFFLKQEV